MRDLAAHPDAINTAIEEFLRMESSNQLGNRARRGRHARSAITTMPAGTYVHLCTARPTAIRRSSPSLMHLDIRRAPNRHLAFGFGIHTCAGTFAGADGGAGRDRQARAPLRVDRARRRAVRGGRARFRGFRYPVSVRAEEAKAMTTAFDFAPLVPAGLPPPAVGYTGLPKFHSPAATTRRRRAAARQA